MESLHFWLIDFRINLASVDQEKLTLPLHLYVVVPVVPVVVVGGPACPALINPAKVTAPVAKADFRTKSRRSRELIESVGEGASFMVGCFVVNDAFDIDKKKIGIVKSFCELDEFFPCF